MLNLLALFVEIMNDRLVIIVSTIYLELSLSWFPHQKSCEL